MNRELTYVNLDNVIVDDSTDNRTKSIVSKLIRERIENGATVDDLTEYKANTLKIVLSFYRVHGRSKITYKEDMAIKLIETFGSPDGPKHGKRSIEVPEVMDDRALLIERQKRDNEIYAIIKRNGGSIK